MNWQKAKKLSLRISQNHNFQKMYNKILQLNLENINISIAFLGEFNSGKTTLVNSLMRTNILPAFEEPTTAVITKIISGKYNKFYKTPIDDISKKIEIDPYELGDEITNTAENHHIVVELEDNEFINKNIEIIDTPGVSSIEKMHDDITYGYLPKVDVGFLCIDIEHGGISKSLLDFLSHFPKKLLNKLYFVITKKDLKNEKTINKVLNNTEEELSKIIDNPKVLSTAAIKVENSTGDQIKPSKESGIEKIENIIFQEVLPKKKQFQKNHLKEKLSSYIKDLIRLLEDSKKSLTWTDNRLNKKIKENKVKIDGIKSDIISYKNKVDNIKSNIKLGTNKIIEEYSGILAQKISTEQNILKATEMMINEINREIEDGFRKLIEIEFKTIDDNIGKIIKLSLSNETQSIIQIAKYSSKVAIFLILWLLIPGSSAALEAGEAIGGGVGTLLTNISSNSDKEDVKEGENKDGAEKAKKIKNAIANFIEKNDIVGKLTNNLILPLAIKGKIRNSLQNRISNKIEYIFKIIDNDVNELIEERYLTRLEDINNSLEKLRQQRDEKSIKVDQKAKEIDKNLGKLKNISL